MFQKIPRFLRLRRVLMLCILACLVISQMGLVPVEAKPNAISWVPLGKGAEYAWMPYMLNPSRAFVGNIFVVRLAPSAAIFKIYYQPDHRQTVRAWAAQMPGANLIVNASYFDSAGRAIGLVKLGADTLSVATGNPNSGLFISQNNVPQVLPSANVPMPNSDAAYSEYIESYPVLITGQHLANFPDDPSLRERRSIIAQDTNGNILIIFTSALELSLWDAANWLQSSGLNIVTALNLDGGTSSQLHISARGDFSQLVQGKARVPVVLAIFLH